MRFFLLAVASQAFTVHKPEAALLQEAANAKLETGNTVVTLLNNMLDDTKSALTTKQDDLATERTTCDTNIASRKKEIEDETSQKALTMAEVTAYSAKAGAYSAKCSQAAKRKDDSAQAQQEADDTTNAAQVAALNEQILECNTLASAMAVLTNKQTSALQTNGQAMVQTMSKEMKDKLYDVVSRETNVVDADTVMAALQKSSYSTNVGQQGGFGAIVGIVMGLHNACENAKEGKQTELAQFDDALLERQSLTQQIAASDSNQWNNCLSEQAAALENLSVSNTELARAETALSTAVSSLSDDQNRCNDVISQAVAFIRNHKEVVATVTEVLAILDHTFADQAEFIQLSASVGQPAHARADLSFASICGLVDKMRAETDRQLTTFQREKTECNAIMPRMMGRIVKLDAKISSTNTALTQTNQAIRGSLHDGHSSLTYQIEEKLPQEVITEKVELQRESNERKADSEANAAEIATQQRYIAECKDAIQKLQKISGFSTTGDNGTTAIQTIITKIEDLNGNAKDAIEAATNTEKTNHADYMNQVADTNSEISLLMNEIAEKKGQRAQEMKKEISHEANLASLTTEKANLVIDFTASCIVYGNPTYQGATPAAVWTDYDAANQQQEADYQQVIDELNILSGTISCGV